ncbi:MAG: riboflavin synthase [bacterium]
MFTGIIQDLGTIEAVTRSAGNADFRISTPKLAGEVAVGDSVAVNGVCLTSASESKAGEITLTAVAETLSRTTLSELKAGVRVNLELATRAGDRLGGHLVQGHVDTTGKLLTVTQAEGSWLLTFSYPRAYAQLLIEKGSIAVDGISLTAYNRSSDRFTVSVVPHTWQSTNLARLRPGAEVNLEFDLIGKYILNFQQSAGDQGLTMAKLRDAGF